MDRLFLKNDLILQAETDRPSAAEEELHSRYRNKFGKLPKYVKHT